MPSLPIPMPQLGESIAEATVVSIDLSIGQEIEADSDIMEVETNKATMSVTTPYSGKVTAIHAEVGQTYPVGAPLVILEVAPENAPASEPPSTPSASATSSRIESTQSTATPSPHEHRVEPTVSGLPVPANATGATYLSPRLKARMEELGFNAADLAGMAGSGAGGRLTIEDFENHIESLQDKPMSQASTMRVAVADGMRRSWTRPLATVGIAFCLDPLLTHRKTSQAGPALYALRALGLALAEDSAPAGRLLGHQIIHPDKIDIGFAVEVEDGVLVPVLRQVHRHPLAELLPLYTELMEQARQRKLPLDASGGSIATVTNYGTFNIQWATPIPLPEQTLVLGLGAGRMVPFWDEQREEFTPRREAGLSLSFDHRVLDGGAAGRLLHRIATLLESPDNL